MSHTLRETIAKHDAASKPIEFLDIPEPALARFVPV
jgi:hypothetical protein